MLIKNTGKLQVSQGNNLEMGSAQDITTPDQFWKITLMTR
jgi:hypothetical protein